MGIYKSKGTFLIAMAGLLLSCAGSGDPAMEYGPAALSEDFGQFRSIIEKRTAGLYADRDMLREMLDHAETQIKAPMTELEFYRLLAPIAAGLKCGHSFLSVSSATERFMKEQGKFFPLEVRIIDGRLFVISDPYSREAAPGSEILSINQEPVQRIIEKITGNMPTDGSDRGRPRYDAERWFASMYYAYIDNPDYYALELLDPEEGKPNGLRLPAVRDRALAKTSIGIVHETADTPYRLVSGKDYAMAVIPTFAYSDMKKYGGDLEDFFRKIRSENTPLLIVDLRGNYGGSTKPTIELFRYLIDRPLPFYAEDNPFYLSRWKKPVEPSPWRYEGRLYILMDEAGFSMNSFLLSLLKYHRIGHLYGTRSSGGYMCSDASMNAVLKNTGLRFRFSTGVFRVEVEGLEAGMGIDPDVTVRWEISDYITGRDPVLEAVFQDAIRTGTD